MAYDPNSKHNTYDPTEEMSGWQKYAAGMGKSFADPWLRLKQLAGAASQKDVDEATQRDRALMNTGAGLAGNVTGSVAQSIPLAGGLGIAAKAVPMLGRAAAAAPLASRIGSAGLQGGLQGAAAPVTSEQTAAGNIAGGAAMGAAGQGIASTLSAAARPAINAATPAISALARKAEQLGIPLTAAQVSGSPIGRAATNFFGGLPLGGSGKKAEQQIAGFNKNVTGTFGPQTEDAVRAVGTAKKSLGQGFNDISDRNTLLMTQGDFDKLDAIPLTHLANTGESGEANSLQTVVDNIKKLHRDNGGQTPGTQYQGWRSNAGTNANSATGNMKNSWNAVQSALDDAMDRSMPQADRDAWADLRQKYSAMKTVERALPASGEANIEGTIDPKKLSAVMNSNSPRNAANRNAMQQPVGTSGSDLADVAQVGNAFVPKTVPDSLAAHLPAGVGEALKGLGREGATFAGAAGVGFGGAHLGVEGEWAKEHPLEAAAITGAGATALGTTAGRALTSDAFRRGSPLAHKLLEGAADRGIPAGIGAAASKASHSADATPAAEATATQTDPFSGMEPASSDEMKGAYDPFAK
jgi:hypothetical protein